MLNVALDDKCGEAVEESNPESNPRECFTCSHLLLCTKATLSFLCGGFGLTTVLPALVIDDAPTPESPPINRIQSPVTETLGPKSSTTASSLSPAPSSRSASPFIQDKPTTGPRTEHVSDIVGSTGSPRNQSTGHYCAECKVQFKTRSGYQQHMATSNAHATSGFRCRCKRLFGRKSELRNHIISENRTCRILAPYVCLCGYKVKNNCQDPSDLIMQHINTCQHTHREHREKEGDATRNRDWS